MTRMMGRVRKVLKLREIEFEKGSFADTLLRSVKYLILFLIFYYTLSASELFFHSINPSNIFKTIAQSDFNIWITSIFIYIFVVSLLFIKKFWCRYICPVGAAINILNYFFSSVALFLLFVFFETIGINIEWQYYLAGACIIGYFNEIINPARSKDRVRTQVYDYSNSGFNACAPKSYNSLTCSAKVVGNKYPAAVLRVDDIFMNRRYNAIALSKRKRLHAFFPVIILFLVMSIAIYFSAKIEITPGTIYYSKVAVNNNN